MHETCQIVTKLEGEIINFLILLDSLTETDEKKEEDDSINHVFVCSLHTFLLSKLLQKTLLGTSAAFL